MIKLIKILKKFSAICLVFFAFSFVLNANAAPEIVVGLNLEYLNVGLVGTDEILVLSDNGDTWTCYRFRFLEIDPPGNEYTYFVKKVASQHTYDYNLSTIIPFIDGFPFWIDTVGLLISEFITIFDDQYQITEQLQITVPLGTFTVYKAVEDNPIYTDIYYYDVDTGFLVKAEYDNYGYDSVLLSITIIVISEFPVFVLPILLIAIPLTIKYSKIFKK